MRNSSPPSRPQILALRVIAFRISANDLSTISPASCPWVSLTVLKRSKSAMATQTEKSCLAAALNWLLTQRSIARRLWRPVRGSVSEELRSRELEVLPTPMGRLEQSAGNGRRLVVTLRMRWPSNLALLLECSTGLLPLANPQLRSALASAHRRLRGRSIRTHGKPLWRWRRHKQSPFR